jgi:hypothetical protein
VLVADEGQYTERRMLVEALLARSKPGREAGMKLADWFIRSTVQVNEMMIL